jgi:thioredoxin 1
MSITFILIAAAAILLIAYMIYNYKKMQNLPNTPDNAKIKILNNKNFKSHSKSGIVLVDFWAPWCAPCKMMAPILNDLAGTVDDNVTIAKVNVDEQQDLSRKYNIRSIPTLLMFKDGKVINSFTGVKTKSFLLKQVKAQMSN